MTAAQLKRWRELGFEFGEDYDAIAQDAKPALSIRFISTKKDDKFYYVNIEFTAKNFKTDIATISLQSLRKVFSYDNFGLVKTIKFKAEINSYEFKFEVDPFEPYRYEKIDFTASITCNNINAISNVFQIEKVEKKENEYLPEKCFCNKPNWTADDLKYIVTELRKREKTGDIQILRDINNTKNFAIGEPIKDSNGKVIKKELSIYDSIANDKKQIKDRLFYLQRGENVVEGDRTYQKLVEAINYIFKNVEAKNCINKIHLLSQIYHETERFSTCYESDTSAEKSGEDFYRGRGLIMLTKIENYKAFYKDTYNNEATDVELKELVPKIAKELVFAKKTASWYLKNSKFKEYYNEQDSVKNVSATINYPKALLTKEYDKMNGLKEREMFFNLLKDILNYDECK